jgi:hypothetical protein
MHATLEAIDKAVATAKQRKRLCKGTNLRSNDSRIIHYSDGPGFHIFWMRPEDPPTDGTVYSVADYENLPYHRRAAPEDLIVAIADHVANNSDRTKLGPEDMLLLKYLEGALLAIKMKHALARQKAHESQPQPQAQPGA